MSNSVTISEPQDGWIDLRINNDGQTFEESVSYTPNDFVAELIDACCTCLQGGIEAVATAHCEPLLYELCFFGKPKVEPLHFEIMRYPDERQRQHEVVLATRKNRGHIIKLFWMGLSELKGRMPAGTYQREWCNPFPATSFAHLTQMVHRRRLTARHR